MSKTTVTYNLYLYADQPAAGEGFSCLCESYSTLAEARTRGINFKGTNYEIQSISTTVEPPSKRYPNGETSTSKTIIERKQLREPLWYTNWVRAMPGRTDKPELRFNLGYGYLKLRLPSRADAVKVLVLLRGCKAGFYYDMRANNIIVAKTLQTYSDINKILKREGYCDPGSS